MLCHQSRDVLPGTRLKFNRGRSGRLGRRLFVPGNRRHGQTTGQQNSGTQQSTDSSQLVYRLVYPSGYQPACSIARARTVFIR